VGLYYMRRYVLRLGGTQVLHDGGLRDQALLLGVWLVFQAHLTQLPDTLISMPLWLLPKCVR